MYRIPLYPLARLLAATFLMLASAWGGAQTIDTPSKLRLSGFGTAGAVVVDAPAQWGYRRDTLQPLNDGGLRADIDSRLGLQANYQLTPHLELVGQVLATRRSADAPLRDSLERAFAAYRPTPELTFRLGRLNLDIFLVSEYRNVGFAYPFVRPPVEFYGFLPNNLEGLDATRSWASEGSTWRLKGFLGQAVGGDRAVVPEGLPTRPVFGAMLSREADGLLLRATMSQARIRSNATALGPLLAGLRGLASVPSPAVAAEAAALIGGLDLTSRPTNYLALGINYDRNGWLAIAEATHLTGAASLTAGYVTLGRRLGSFTPYVTVSGVRSKSDVRSSPQWQAALAPILGAAAAQQAQALGDAASDASNMSRGDQRGLSLGLRWDMNDRTALKLQYDHIRVGANGNWLLWANGTAGAANANIATATLDFLF